MATKIAHAYPGQGAQFPEMGKYLSRKALQIATESFQKLITALEKQDKEILTETEFVQPAVYLVEASLMEKLPSPSLVLGHSSGEYAALVEARVWDVRTGFEIIRARAISALPSHPRVSWCKSLKQQTTGAWRIQVRILGCH